jgi:glycyl-tRNA synthetase
MELEFFTKPDTDLEWFNYWRSNCMKFLTDIGLKEENLRFRDHDQKELSFYSKATTDIEFKYPFGWGELWGIADRTDYDLNRHMEYSKKDLSYLDPTTNEKYVPYVIEPSVGADRLFLSVLADAYDEEQLENDTRIVMHFHPALAPVKVAVLPLSKKQKDEAEKLFMDLSKDFACEFDLSGKIGKRYRRQDAIGTPLCVTVDFDTAEDGSVTVRDRDSMEQVRLPISELKSYIAEKLKF